MLYSVYKSANQWVSVVLKIGRAYDWFDPQSDGIHKNL